jgi:hypothetical protein
MTTWVGNDEGPQRVLGTLAAAGRTYQITGLRLAEGLLWIKASLVAERDEPKFTIDSYVVYDLAGNEVIRSAPTFETVVVPNVKANDEVAVFLSLAIQVTGTRHPAKVS